VKGGIVAIITFVVISTAIAEAVTGTDTGSVLIQAVGTLVAGGACIYAFVKMMK